MIKIDCDNREMLISLNSIVCVTPSNREEKEYLIEVSTPLPSTSLRASNFNIERSRDVEFKETSSFLISQKEFNQLNVKIQQICEDYV